MSSDALLAPAWRDALLAVVALALLATPVWAPVAHLGDPATRYERARVTVTDGTIQYAAAPDAEPPGPVSTEIACTDPGFLSRGCFFEHHLAANNTVTTGFTHTLSGDAEFPTFERYRYAIVDGTVYETDYVANRSRRDDEGMYRVELALDPASAEAALRSVSVSVEDVPAPVREAATTGGARAARDVDVPRTPVRLDDGSYYRVYAAGTTPPSDAERAAAGLLQYGGPLAGLGLASRLARRFEVTYVGTDCSG